MNTMTQTRAKEIMTAAADLSEKRFGIRAGWDAFLGPVMTADERAAVTAVWKTLPGHYSFSRTLAKIARTRKP